MAEDTDKVELQRQINELRWELRDTRINTINWWLAVNGFILAFFGIVVVIGGYVGFTRFQKLENETQNYVEKMKERLDKDVQEIQEKIALVRNLTSEEADNPGKTEQVKEAVLEVQQNPTSSPLDLAIANAVTLQRVRRIDAAIAKWRSIANVAEGIDNELAARAWFSVGYLLQKGRTEEDKAKDAQPALFAYDEAIRLRPDYPEAYNNRGNAKQDLGRNGDAIADYDEAIRLRPDLPEAYYNRGAAKQDLGRHGDAIADYDEAIRLRPDYPGAYNNRGNAKRALDRNGDAIADYDEAIRLRPDLPEAYNNRGNAKRALGRHGDAIADYDEAIRLRPDFPEAYNNRGAAKQDLGRNGDAIADYDEAIRLRPDYPEAYYNRGNAKQDLGRNGDAIADYDEAIRLRPDYPEAYYNRGRTKIASGRNTDGKNDLETALELAQKANNMVTKSRAEQQLQRLNPNDAP